MRAAVLLGSGIRAPASRPLPLPLPLSALISTPRTSGSWAAALARRQGSGSRGSKLLSGRMLLLLLLAAVPAVIMTSHWIRPVAHLEGASSLTVFVTRHGNCQQDMPAG